MSHIYDMLRMFIASTISSFFDANLDFETETVVRREINQKGKSRAFINDTPVLLQVLTVFGKQIVEIYAQHQSVLFKDEDAQFKLIDQLAKSEKELSESWLRSNATEMIFSLLV